MMMKTNYRFIVMCVDREHLAVHYGTGDTLEKAEKNYKRSGGRPATTKRIVTRRMFWSDVPFGENDSDAQAWVEDTRIRWYNCDSINLDHP